MSHSWEYYNEIAGKYDFMYDEPYWMLYHQILSRLVGDHFNREGKVLDLGTGTGRWAIDLALDGAEVYAVDPSEKMLDVAAEKAKQYEVHVNFKKGNGEALEFDNASFDLVLAMGDVLSYSENPGLVVKEIHRVLKKDGILLATVDSGFAFLNDFLSNCEFNNAKHHIEKKKRVTIGDHTVSEKTFKTLPFFPEELYTLMEENDLTLVDMAGMVVFGPYSERLLARNLDEVTDWEYRYCRRSELMGRAEHLFFCGKKE